MNVNQARDLMTAIESFGLLQFIEVSLVLLALGIVWFLVRGQRSVQDATITALRDAKDTQRQMIEVVQRNTAAEEAAKQATEAQSASFVAALEKVVGELITARSADGEQRKQLREAIEHSMTSYGDEVTARFDAIKKQLDGISEQLDGVKAVPDLVTALNAISERLTALEKLVTAPPPAPAPTPFTSIAPPETT